MMTNAIEMREPVVSAKNDTEQYFFQLIQTLGDNPLREGLLKTPKRAKKAFEFLTRGYHEDLQEIINGALFSSDANDMVLVKNIELYSLCEHHLLPFFGTCHVAYLPNGKVLGLSKIARIVDHFAKRFQIQENLNQQIAKAIAEITNAAGVGVVIEAKHLCMMMRGVEKQNATMVTTALLGEFRENNQLRHEFLQNIQ